MYAVKWIKTSGNLNVTGSSCWHNLLTGLLLTASVLSSQAQSSINVTNYGAVGDAVQFYANTVSNSTVITVAGTNVFSSADVGKAIEVFNCSTNTSGTNCQDMVATIASVDGSGTNITLSQVCQNTLTNTFATAGTDNSLAFSNAIQSVVNSGSTNTVINVPAGKYLCLTHYIPKSFANQAILIKGGGWHLVGEGTNSTTLLSQGAWTMQNGAVWRGFLIAILPPITNDYPVSIENLTLDGGVQVGNTTRHGFPASPVDGMGWDMTHDAIDERGATGPVFTHWTWTNLLFTHWRGEIVKSNGQATNGNLTMVNCTFRDGNASALNIYDSQVVTNCVFDNLFMLCEYYMAYSTNTSYFVNNLITNVSGNAMSFNGANGRNPPYIIQNNQFYNVAGNGFATTPGDNIVLTTNQFYNVNNPIVIGAAGYQGTFINSNITVSFNTFSNSGSLIQMGGYVQGNANGCSDVRIFGNTVIPPIRTAFLTASWCDNVSIYSNTITLASDGTIIGTTITTGQQNGAPFLLFETNNQVWTRIAFATTNQIAQVSYGQGSRFQFVYRTLTNSVLALVTTNASQIPAGATIIITNSSFIDAQSSGVLPVYLNSDLSGNPVFVGQGEAQAFYWNKIKGGYAWMTHQIIPPLNLRTNLNF